MRLLAALSLIVIAHACAAAEVYRWVDRNGNVIFSDTPQPGAEKVKIHEPTIVPGTPAQTAGPLLVQESAAKPLPYESVRIASPADEETVRNNTGKVTVSVALVPDLQDAFGHTLGLLYDGKPVGPSGTSKTFVLQNVTRGAHKLQAQVFNTEGFGIGQSSTTTFYLHQHSVLHPVP